MEEKGPGAEKEQILKNDEIFALTGYFNDGRKRIDLVLVFKELGSNVVEKMRLNFLMNAIQFGFEAEFETGKMFEHRNLIFIKLHAPDAIIEEFGLYYDEKSIFKDSHIEFINPIINIMGISNERELIKIVRTHYPGPDNYSTLERSIIVYRILLEEPFRINHLIAKYVIQDVFALHDGPYFILPKQSSTNINARQVLFYEWLGVRNIWKKQPIHMIHEYFGKRVENNYPIIIVIISYYFAFYEFFNLMLIFPSIKGVITIYYLYRKAHSRIFKRYKLYCSNQEADKTFMCPECRNFTLCPIVRRTAYCKELLYLEMIDQKELDDYAIFITICGIIFLITWRYRETYLSWIWEETKKYTNKLVRPEYTDPDLNITKEKKNSALIEKIRNIIIKIVIYISTIGLLVLLGFQMFRFSIIIFHYPRWRRLQDDPKKYIFKEDEYFYIAIGAGFYTIIMYIFKMVISVLAKIITGFENNKTFSIYNVSIALKMYLFSFISSYFIIITYTYMEVLFVTLDDPNQFNSIYGYSMINSGIGSTYDDICVTIGIMTMFEHVVLKIAGLIVKNPTDYPFGCNHKVPCWEREYKLKTITEFFLHKGYNALAMQFALITCYSMTFSVAPLFLFIVNLWDIRHTARQFLLECRRPLLINKSGPGFWKYMFLLTVAYAPMSNVAIFIFQSSRLRSSKFTRYFKFLFQDFPVAKYLTRLNESISDYNDMKERILLNFDLPKYCRSLSYISTYESVHRNERQLRRIVVTTAIPVVIFFILNYIIPGTSTSMKDTIKKEKRIKNKYNVRKSLLIQ